MALLRVFSLPLGLTALLAALALTPRVQASATLAGSIAGAVVVLLAWQFVLFRQLQRLRSVRSFEVVLRPQHYVQALVQLAIFLYWGYFWRPVYDHSVLLLAQLVFAYAFDILLTWSRRERYVLGFGPFPIIFSANLFLWFRDDWFYLQFLMIAAGFLGKEFVRWHRDGRETHIFNPSAFALGLFSLVLLATGTTDLTWGQSIATTLTLAPHIYLFIFLTGLVVMYCFSITLIAGCAALMLFGLSAAWYAATGVPYFVDSDIPAAVFLGLHLLVTDPSTSARSPVGKAIFGALYGLGVFVLYALLGALGEPTFYDKLLCVPLLNLSVQAIDRFALWLRDRARLVPEMPFVRSNAVHMAVWIAVFGTMTAVGKTDGRHVGDSMPFWIGACDQERRGACERLLALEAAYCGDNSAWACNELGWHYAEGDLVDRDRERARDYFAKGCETRFPASCRNLLSADDVVQADPHPLDLRLLLREGGLNLTDATEQELYARACDHGWEFACAGGARLQ